MDKTAKIKQAAKKLRLPTVRNDYTSLVEKANKEGMEYEKFIIELLQRECRQRSLNKIDRLIERADFPYIKYLEDIEVDKLPRDCMANFGKLQSLNFISENKNVIFAGSPGTGKSHMAIGLGIEACRAEYKVYYCRIAKLVRESKTELGLEKLNEKFSKYDLIICDEIGYTSLDNKEAELLFELLSLRTNKTTIIITNLSFDMWDSLFENKITAITLIDRITYNAHILDMNGPSYRNKKTVKNE